MPAAPRARPALEQGERSREQAKTACSPDVDLARNALPWSAATWRRFGRRALARRPLKSISGATGRAFGKAAPGRRTPNYFSCSDSIWMTKSFVPAEVRAVPKITTE
jgi:hypothetical protein